MTTPRSLKYICLEHFRKEEHLLTNDLIPTDLKEAQLVHNLDMYREEHPSSVERLALIMALSTPFASSLIIPFAAGEGDRIDVLIILLMMHRTVAIIQEEYPISHPLPYLDEFRTLHRAHRFPGEEDSLANDILLEELAVARGRTLGWADWHGPSSPFNPQ